MNWKCLLLSGITVLSILACEEDIKEMTLDARTASLVQAVDEEMNPLSASPLLWTDNDLDFLTPIADNPMIALGEATHGTAEFFEAKHRIFQYLVENHNFKVFAFEADFGESLFINELVQNSASDEIEEAMKTKMHFWTWKTEEVKELLLWMCNYNRGKADEDKVQYMGVDCQYNTFHPAILKDYLSLTEAPFLPEYESTLDEAKTAAQANFASYSEQEFYDYLKKLDALGDSIDNHKTELVQVSSEQEFQLHRRVLEVIRQVSESSYFNQHDDNAPNYRDQYMAENTTWLLEYFNGQKIALWAHNAHIANNPNYGIGGSQGYHLAQRPDNGYKTIGFLFSQGSFTAVGQVGQTLTSLRTHAIREDPKIRSANFALSRARDSVYALKVEDLQTHSEWKDAFSDGIQFFQIGSLFNNKPEDYYLRLEPQFFDYIIYFDETTASVLLPS